MELDHVFICVRPGAPEGDALCRFGLTEGAPNHHSGQGTANRRFFFHNAFLELLYLDDLSEAQRGPVQRTRLAERLTGEAPGVSPFGMCFRPTSGQTAPDFPSWTYRPAYLPDGVHIDVGHAPPQEPMWFFLSFGSRPDRWRDSRKQPLTHDRGFKEITSVSVTVPNLRSRSEAANQASTVDAVRCVERDPPLLTLGFDDETQGRRQDFRPALPLVFEW